MAITLYDISVASYLQTVAAVGGFLEKASPSAARKASTRKRSSRAASSPDMKPFRFQIQQVAMHSIGAIDSLKAGVRRPPGERPMHDYAGLQTLIKEADEALRELTPGEIDALEGTEVVLEMGETKRVFTATGFILSFSLPNFHFHATTAYDLLRGKGVPLGKRDYMGALRLKA